MTTRTEPVLRLDGWHGVPLERATLERRYKRFLADVRLADGRIETVHCANSGSMLGMDAPGSPVVVSDSLDPRRRLRRTLEFVQVDDGGGRTWVGVNTMRPNRWVEEIVRAARLPGVPAGGELRREVPLVLGGESGRLDLLVAPAAGPRVFIEVKNTTLAAFEHGAVTALFPDAVTARGRKHLRLLAAAAARGDRAIIAFLVNRGDAARFRPAAQIDAAYAEALDEAAAAGVEVVALQVRHAARRTGGAARVSSSAIGVLPVEGVQPPVVVSRRRSGARAPQKI